MLPKVNVELKALALVVMQRLLYQRLNLGFECPDVRLGLEVPDGFDIRDRAMATGFCFNIGRFFTASSVFFVGALVNTLGGYGPSLFAFSFVFLIGLLFIVFTRK